MVKITKRGAPRFLQLSLRIAKSK